MRLIKIFTKINDQKKKEARRSFFSLRIRPKAQVIRLDQTRRGPHQSIYDYFRYEGLVEVRRFRQFIEGEKQGGRIKRI